METLGLLVALVGTLVGLPVDTPVVVGLPVNTVGVEVSAQK